MKLIDSPSSLSIPEIIDYSTNRYIKLHKEKYSLNELDLNMFVRGWILNWREHNSREGLRYITAHEQTIEASTQINFLDSMEIALLVADKLEKEFRAHMTLKNNFGDYKAWFTSAHKEVSFSCKSASMAICRAAIHFILG